MSSLTFKRYTYKPTRVFTYLWHPAIIRFIYEPNFILSPFIQPPTNFEINVIYFRLLISISQPFFLFFFTCAKCLHKSLNCISLRMPNQNSSFVSFRHSSKDNQIENIIKYFIARSNLIRSMSLLVCALVGAFQSHLLRAQTYALLFPL